jgi:hypothetical protein
MIVPFFWAIALLGAGVASLLVTIYFAAAWFWPRKIDAGDGVGSSGVATVNQEEVERLGRELDEATKINRLQATHTRLTRENANYHSAAASAEAAFGTYQGALTEMLNGDFEAMHRGGIALRFSLPAQELRNAEAFVRNDPQYQTDSGVLPALWGENPNAGGISTTGIRFVLDQNVAFIEAVRHNAGVFGTIARNIRRAADRKAAELGTNEQEIAAENARLENG